MTEPTSTADLEEQILRALADIRKHWHALLPDAPGAIRPTRAAARRLYTLPDDDESGADLPRLDVTVDLRREVTLALNGWARVIVEDRALTKVIPNGADTLGLVAFLERHAQWFSGHEAAPEAADELTGWAEEVRAAAEPRKRDWVILGPCPFVIEERFCPGRVRSAIHDGAWAHCSEHGEEAITEWWEQVLGIDTLPKDLIGPKEVADLLAQRLFIRVTHRTVLNWTKGGRLTQHVAFGPQPETPRCTTHSVYDARLVLDEAARMGRACATCGNEFAGRGDQCARCISATPTAARHAEPKPAFIIGIAPRRPKVEDPTDTDRPERCHWSDLIIGQCACGRHAQPA